MRIVRITLFVALCAICVPTFASPLPGDTIRAPRPKVGIVLSGGGAKGAAHIGALKYIEEVGIPVDYVVGTSMGSIIGGLYALGYTPDEIESMISHLDWSKYMSNNVARRDVSSADKQRRSTYLINIPFNDGELFQQLRGIKADEPSTPSTSFISSLPDSFIGGTDLLNLFNSLCIGYQDSLDFNELPIPFACVATNINTGDAVVLRSGKFPEAIRASMAIPGVFSPMTINGQVLVDGGLVNNFPTDVCRDMGADIIIGIEVARQMSTNTDIKSLPQLASQMMSIMTKGHNQENRELCDLYIHPKVNDFGMLSFTSEAIDTIVQRGYSFTSQFHDELATIKRYIDSFEPTVKTLQAPKAQYVMDDTIQLENITMNNVNHKEFNWLLRKSRLELGKNIPSSDLQQAVNTFKGTGNFNSIEYRLSPAKHPADPPVKNDFDLKLDFHPAEPHNLSLGLNYDSEESAGMIVNLGIGQNKFSGLKFNLTGRLGFNTKISTTLTWAGISLANFNLSYEFIRAKYNYYIMQQTSALTFKQHRLKLYISEFHLRSIQTSVGWELEGLYGPFAKLTFDNMDHAYFATQGLKANMEFHERFGNPQGSAITDISFNVADYHSVGRFTFIPQVYSRFVISNDFPLLYSNIIGGEVYGRYYDYQMPFVGINYTTYADSYAAIARLDLRYRFYRKHYITAIANVMRSADNLGTLLSLDDEGVGHWGCALKYSYDSPIGPISFDLHYSDITNTWGSYFSLGYVF